MFVSSLFNVKVVRKGMSPLVAPTIVGVMPLPF